MLEETRTSELVVMRAFQSIRGKMLMSSLGLRSISSWTSSASLGWRGKEVLLDLQALTAQVRKLRVRTFMVTECCCWRFEMYIYYLLHKMP